MPANLEVRVELMALDDPNADEFDDRPMEPKDALLLGRFDAAKYPTQMRVHNHTC